MGELHAKLGSSTAMCARTEAGPTGGGGAWPGFETTHRATYQRPGATVWRAPERSAAVPVGGGGAWPGFETTRRATHQRPSPTGVKGAGGSGGPGCGARGRWRGLAGLRDDAPSEARGADGSRAGRRPPAHTAAGPSGAQNTRGPTSNTATQPGPPAPRTPVGPHTPPEH